jgi:methyl-accepting chemotaxis protein
VTEYSYDDYRVTLDSNDSSKNTASDIQGYPLDIQLDPSWPGLSVDPNKVRADHDKMNALADQIDQMVQNLQDGGSGTPGSIVSASSQARYGPDTWFAAKSLKSASDQVATTVSKYSQDLLANLQAASAAIRQAAGTYQQADRTSQQAAQTQDQNLQAGSQPRNFG